MPLDAPPLPPVPIRSQNAHKGTAGTVAVVGGSDDDGRRMIGAPVLAAHAAIRAGAGLVRLVMPEHLLTAGLSMCPAATGVALPWDTEENLHPNLAADVMDTVIEDSDVLVVGPGLGDPLGVDTVTLRAVQQERIPVVVDADAINALCRIPRFMMDVHAAAVFTPHPGEFKRLCAAMGLKGELGLEESRADACERMAQRLGRIVVLKGAGTVVSDGHRTWTCQRGHPCLATGGTGDVLSGIIAGVIAQFVPSVQITTMRTLAPRLPTPPGRPLDLFDAARLGVEIHARAGEAWAARERASTGLNAADLPDLVPGVMETLRASARS